MVKVWSFKPYHQRIDESLDKDPGEVSADTEWKVWEVFRQPERGKPHRHVGGVHAPDAENALLLAKEQFTRREDCVNLWVVPSEEVQGTAYDDEDMFRFASDRTYRLTKGFPVGEKLREVRDMDLKPMAEEHDE